MGKYKSDYTGLQIDGAVDCVLNLFINKGLDTVEGIVKRNSDGSFGVATIVWNDIEQKPTTIVGYGITDAKIENGVVTLGANTITPVPTSMVKTVVNDTDAEISTSKAIKTYVDTYGGKIDTISVNGTVQTITNKNVNLLVAELDSNGKVLVNQLPSYVSDVLEYATVNNFPATGESGKIYIALDTNLTYRWGGSTYVEISQSLALGETSQTAFRGDHGAAAYGHAMDISKIATAQTVGLYKIGVTDQGHISGVTAIVKADITDLGIPAQDTTYENKSAASGGTDVSLVTTGEKYIWNNKQDALVSGTNIKTINNQSILGSGNLSIVGGVSDVTVDGVSVVTNNIAVISLAGKQDALVSGTNIKTINNNSILGSGNLTIDGGCAVQIVRW